MILLLLQMGNIVNVVCYVDPAPRTRNFPSRIPIKARFPPSFLFFSFSSLQRSHQHMFIDFHVFAPTMLSSPSPTRTSYTSFSFTLSLTSSSLYPTLCASTSKHNILDVATSWFRYYHPNNNEHVKRGFDSTQTLDIFLWVNQFLGTIEDIHSTKSGFE